MQRTRLGCKLGGTGWPALTGRTPCPCSMAMLMQGLSREANTSSNWTMQSHLAEQLHSMAGPRITLLCGRLALPPVPFYTHTGHRGRSLALFAESNIAVNSSRDHLLLDDFWQVSFLKGHGPIKHRPTAKVRGAIPKHSDD